MKIHYKHGDLMLATEAFVVQGCNAQGAMGSGVAKLLRDHDENIYLEYRKVYEAQGKRLDLGQTIWVKSNPWIVINAITQEFYGREEGRVYVSYDAVHAAMVSINNTIAEIHEDTLDTLPPVRVAMPLIGAGLAQGRWSVISEIIENTSQTFEPVVYLQNGVIPDGVVAEIEKV